MCGQNVPDLFSILILGCGNIAGRYDEIHTEKTTLTHAGAFSRHPKFKITACVEPDETRRREFMEYWKIPNGYSSLNECRQNIGLNFDVACICTPTENHAQNLDELLDSPVHLVFCEKPIAISIDDAHRIVNAYDTANRPMIINYLRRWNTDFHTLQMQIESGMWGEVQSITARYVNGILNGGSHIIDLMQYLVGPLRVERITNVVKDGRQKDVTLDAILRTENEQPIYLIGSDIRDYSLFELDIHMTKGRLNIDQLGCRLNGHRVEDSPMFPGYFELGTAKISENPISGLMEQAVEEIYSHLMGSTEELISTGKTALATQNICAQLLQLSLTGEIN